jgi:hypothetical protein
MRRLSGVGVGFIDKERQRKADETTQLLFAKMVCRAMHTILTILLYSRFLSLSRGSRSLVLTAWAHSHPHLLFPGGKPFPGLPITLNHGCAPSIGANHLVRRYGSQTREVACPTPASVYTSRDLSLLGSLLHPPAGMGSKISPTRASKRAARGGGSWSTLFGSQTTTPYLEQTPRVGP